MATSPDSANEPTSEKRPVPEKTYRRPGFFSNLKLPRKLLLGFAAINVVIIGAASIVAIDLQHGKNEIAKVSESVTESLGRVTPMLATLEASAQSVVEMGSNANLVYVQLQKIDKLTQKFVAASADPGQVRELATDIEKSVANGIERIQLIRGLVDLTKRTTDESGGNFTALRREINTMSNLGGIGAQIGEVIKKLEIEAGFGIFVVVALSIVTSIMLSRAITLPLDVVVDRAKRLAQRNLEHDHKVDAMVERKDELGELSRAFVAMENGLREMVGAMQSGAKDLSKSANEISAATQQAASTASEQQATVTQVNTTTEELQQTAKASAHSADTVMESSEQAANRGREGLASVEDANETMNVISERVKEIAAKTLHLSEQNNQVGEIIMTVNEIAEQSNLLAVNASIEAAKAGEQGRGFSVVATEVRNLSEQSKRCTRQVRTILDEISKATQSAVMSAEEGTKRVEDGREAVQSVQQVIGELSNVLDENSDNARQIAGASSQQSAGVQEIGRAIEALAQASSSSAEGTRSLEGAATNLVELADNLEGMTRRYVL
jgi:methyl-accepting chemotaxis protein